MSIYIKSLSHLKRKVRNGITKEEWDEYAYKNNLYSSEILMYKKNVDDFEKLKVKVKKEKERLFTYNHNAYKVAKKLQRHLDKLLIKKELDSPEVIELSSRIDEWMNKYFDTLEETEIEYPENNKLYEAYKMSCCMLEEHYMTDGKFPTVEEWNKYAKNTGLLMSETIKYISGLEWHLLEKKLHRDAGNKGYIEYLNKKMECK